MRVLAIRGANLASFASRFEIDFRVEPLASAGVFAITGPTGSGKSTLLDALCLALYHNTPRLAYAEDRSAAMPDVGDSSLGAADARQVLRRGTSHGFAEVDFRGIDDELYCARWEVSRARGKTNGKLQPAKCTLTRLRDGLVIGRTLSEIREAIEHRIGLSFQQFQRAVLLAQNEFAAFLRAKPDERADLLEALTGTQAYAELSKRCFERAKTYRDELKKLEEKAGEDLPMSREELADLQETLARAVVETAALSDAHAALQREHNQSQQLHERTQRVSEGELEISHAQMLWQSSAQRRGELARRAHAESARPLLQSVQSAQDGYALAAQQFDAASHTAVVRAQQLSAAQAQRALYAEQRAAATQASASAEPKLHEARALERDLREISEQLSALERTHNEQQVLQQRAQQKYAESSAELEQSRAELASWTAWRQQEPQFALYDTRWEQLGTQLQHTERVAAELASAQALLESRAPLAERVQEKHAELVQRAEQAEQQLLRAESAEASAQQALAWLDPDSHRQRERTWQQQESALLQLCEAWKAARSAQQNLQAAQHETSRQHAALELTQSAALRVPDQLRVAEITYATLEAAYQRNLAITNTHAQHFRSQLQDAMPCPVCGATEHPFAEQAPVLDALLASQQAELEQARSRRDAFDRERSRLDGELQSQQAALAHLQANQQRAESAFNDAQAKLQACAPAWPGSLALDESAEPTAITQARASLLQQQRALEQARSALDSAQKQAAEAAQLRHEAANSVRSTRAELMRINPEFTHSQAQLSSARERLAIAEQAWQLALQSWQSAFVELALPSAPALAELSQRFAQGNALRTDASNAQARQSALQNAQLSAQQHAELLNEQSVRLQAQLSELRQRAEAVRTRRAQVLPEADIEAYAQRLLRTQSTTQAAWEKALSLEAAADSALAAARTWLESRQLSRQSAAEAEHAANTEMTAWLDANAAILGLSAPQQVDLEQLLAGPGDWRTEQSSFQREERALEDLQTAQAARIADLTALRAQLGELRPLDQIAAELLQLSQQHKLALQAQVQWQHQAQQDELKRERAAQQQVTLQAEQARSEVWQKLNKFFGSADGKEFKRYAQRSTLDVLLSHANEQLLQFSQRYQLARVERSLGLLVIDREMGDELRPVHSLSGGETFLVALALALALAVLSSARVRVESLFIDEGFGSLDSETLRVAMEALDGLQAQGRRVGVISHVSELADRIGTQIQVVRVAPGRSKLRII